MNIIFDVDDTLYDQLIPFNNACKQIIPDIDVLMMEKIFVASRKYSDQIFNLTEKGVITPAEMHQYRLMKAFGEQEITISQQQTELIQKKYFEQQTKISLLPAMIEILNYASKQNIEMGIITNGFSIHQRMKIRQLQLYRWIKKNNILISEDIGHAKPNVQIFKLLEMRMKIEPDKTYYIGDSFKNDVVGSKSAGWNCIWLNHRNHENENEQIPDYTIRNINELLPLIKLIDETK